MLGIPRYYPITSIKITKDGVFDQYGKELNINLLQVGLEKSLQNIESNLKLPNNIIVQSMLMQSKFCLENAKPVIGILAAGEQQRKDQ